MLTHPGRLSAPLSNIIAGKLRQVTIVCYYAACIDNYKILVTLTIHAALIIC